MKGELLCARCDREMTHKFCVCRSPFFYLKVTFKGKHYEYRKDINGKRFDYDAAIKSLVLFQHSVDSNTFDPATFLSRNLEFKTLMMKWLAERTIEAEAGDITFSYLRNLQSHAKNWFNPFFKGTDVRNVDRTMLVAFKHRLKGAKYNTKKLLLLNLGTFFRWLFMEGVVDRVPVFPKILGDDAIPLKALSVGQQRRAVEKIPEKFRDIFTFGIETGLRVGELGAIKVKDLDLADNQALIQRTWSGYLLKQNTKTNRRQWIPLSDVALEILHRNITGRGPEDFVFLNTHYYRKPRPYKPGVLGVIWRRYRDEEFRNVSLHELIRHSFCTQIVNLGISPLQATVLMRHGNIYTTLGYFHSSVRSLRGIVNQRGKEGAEDTPDTT